MQKLWFVKKRFGWGLAPATWQGWLITAAFVTLLILDFVYIRHSPLHFIVFVFLIILFVIIALLTGEKPGHRKY